MNMNRLPFLLLALSLFWNTSQAAAIKIMPVGDSITWGMNYQQTTSYGGYRDPLYRELNPNAPGTDNYVFVGPYTDNASAYLISMNAPGATNATAHAGVSGAKIKHGSGTMNVTANIVSYMTAYHPDVILLEIGTNDISATTNTEDIPTIEGELQGLVDLIFTTSPTIHLYLSSIIPVQNNDSWIEARAVPYNAYISGTLIPYELNKGRNITFVDLWTPFIQNGVANTSLFGDVYHPNIAGYQVMANTWNAAIVAYAPLLAFRNAANIAFDGSQDMNIPAHDGVTNLMKYAFDMTSNNYADLATYNHQTMTSTGTAGLPQVVTDGTGHLTITFVQRLPSTNPGITYAPQVSGDLTGSWTTLSLPSSTTVLNSTWQRVTYTDPVASGRRFIRVKITSP